MRQSTNLFHSCITLCGALDGLGRDAGAYGPLSTHLSRLSLLSLLSLEPVMLFKLVTLYHSCHSYPSLKNGLRLLTPLSAQSPVYRHS